ncbi:hypothetical protein CCACVL1_02165, partial [Corchorus capsularis]
EDFERPSKISATTLEEKKRGEYVFN